MPKSRLTGIGLVAVGYSDFTVIGRVEEDDGSNGAIVLSVLDLETTEEAAITN